MCWKLATHCWRRGGRWSAKLSTTGCSRRTPRLPFSLGYGCHRETKLTTINGVLLYFSYFLQQSLGKRNYRIMWEINQVKPMFAQSETGRQHQALALSGSTIFFTKKIHPKPIFIFIRSSPSKSSERAEFCKQIIRFYSKWKLYLCMLCNIFRNSLFCWDAE